MIKLIIYIIKVLTVILFVITVFSLISGIILSIIKFIGGIEIPRIKVLICFGISITGGILLFIEYIILYCLALIYGSFG